MRPGFVVVALALTLGLGVTGCPKPPAVADAGTTTVRRLTLGITSEPDTLCPLLTESGTAHEIIGLVWRDAVTYGPDWKTRPDLVERVPSLENGDALVDPVSNKLVVRWRIRPDATWEDGVPVTASDFIAGWRVQRDQSQEIVVGRDDAKRIESIVADDDNRGFTVTWSEANPFFAEPRVHRVLPAHKLTNLVKLKDHAIARAPLSNGPFRLVEWRPGELLRFARNDHYRPRPLLDEVVVRVVPSTSAVLTALESGDIDAAFPTGGPSPIEAQQFLVRANQNGERFQMLVAPGQQWVHVDINTDAPELRDPQVRRALAEALPRAEIVRALSGGSYPIADTYLPPAHWGASTSIAPLAHRVDPSLAKRGLKLQLAGASGSAEGEKLALLLQDAWKRAGVDVTLDLRPFKVFFGEGVRKRKLPHLAVFSWTLDASSMGGAIFRTDRIPSEANGWKGNNTTGYQNDEVTTLLKAADGTLDVAARRAALARVQQLVRDDMPVIPLYFKPVAVLSRKGVEGLAPTGTMTPLAWNAHLWSAP